MTALVAHSKVLYGTCRRFVCTRPLNTPGNFVTQRETRPDIKLNTDKTLPHSHGTRNATQ